MNKTTEKKKVIFWLVEAFLLLFFFHSVLKEKEEKPLEKPVQTAEEAGGEKTEASGLKKLKEDAQIRFYEKQAEWANIGEGED